MREIDYSSFENSKLKLNSSNEVLDMFFSVIRWPHRGNAGAKQTDKQTKVHKNQVIAVICMHAWWFPLYNFLQQQNFLYFTLLSSSTLHNIPKCTSVKGRVSQFFKTSSKDQWYRLPYWIGCVKINSTYSTGEQVVEEGVWVRSTKNNGQLASQIGYHYRFLLSPFCRGTFYIL